MNSHINALNKFKEIYSLKIMDKPFNLSISLLSDVRSRDGSELGSLVKKIERFYSGHINDPKAHLNKDPKEGYDTIFGEKRPIFLHNVLTGTDDYVGAVKIIQMGGFSFNPPRSAVEADYPLNDQSGYAETYWLNFFPKEKTDSARRQHRDGFAKFIDPYDIITKRN
jgi:hypothetical protein